MRLNDIRYLPRVIQLYTVISLEWVSLPHNMKRKTTFIWRKFNWNLFIFFKLSLKYLEKQIVSDGFSKDSLYYLHIIWNIVSVWWLLCLFVLFLCANTARVARLKAVQFLWLDGEALFWNSDVTVTSSGEKLQKLPWLGSEVTPL